MKTKNIHHFAYVTLAHKCKMTSYDVPNDVMQKCHLNLKSHGPVKTKLVEHLTHFYIKM